MKVLKSYNLSDIHHSSINSMRTSVKHITDLLMASINSMRTYVKHL